MGDLGSITPELSDGLSCQEFHPAPAVDIRALKAPPAPCMPASGACRRRASARRQAPGPAPAPVSTCVCPRTGGHPCRYAKRFRRPHTRPDRTCRYRESVWTARLLHPCPCHQTRLRSVERTRLCRMNRVGVLSGVSVYVFTQLSVNRIQI